MSYSTIRTVAALIAMFTSIGFTQATARKPAPASCPRNASGRTPNPEAPVTFEINRGQFPASVRFVSRREGLNLAVTDAGIVFALISSDNTTANVRMKLVGASPTPDITGEDPASLTSNYFVGQDAARWRRNIPSFRRVRMKNVYAGIDLVFHGERGQPEFDFEVAPGADPSVIRYRLSGADKIKLTAAGDLALEAAGLRFGQRKPVLYQSIAGQRRDLQGRFVRRHNEIAFTVGAYDRSAPLVIDPTVTLLFNKTYGPAASSTQNGATGSANGHGAFFVTGTVAAGVSLDPKVTPAIKGPSGSSFAFVSKLDKSGNILWVTYLGGSGAGSYGNSIVLDPDGNIYIAGSTNATDFPMAGKPFQSKNGGMGDVFVAKLDSTGANLIYSSYLGGSQPDYPTGVALDSSRNLIVAGNTNSAGLPTRGASGAAPFQKTYAGDADGFVAKFNADASDLIFLTYLGASGSPSFSFINRLLLDSDGNAIVAGTTNAKSFPTKGAGVLTAAGGGQDAFVTKVNPTGTDVVFSTLLGGSGDDIAQALAITPGKNILVAGATSSKNFPLKDPSQATFAGGNRDGFITRLDPNGVLLQSTYYGTPGDDYVSNIFAASNIFGVILQTDNKQTAAKSKGPQPRDADNTGISNFISGVNPDDLKSLLAPVGQDGFPGAKFTFGAGGFGVGEGQCNYAPPETQCTDANDTTPAGCVDPLFANPNAYFCCPGYAYTDFSQTGNSVPTMACMQISPDQLVNGIPNYLLQQDGGGCCDPVSTGNGEMTDSEFDLPAVGPMRLHLERYYASMMKSNGFSGALGTNWMHNFEQKIAVTGSTAVVTLFPGTQITFNASGSNWQVAGTEKHNYQLLAVSGGGFRFADTGNARIYTFNATGKLTGIADRNGNAITVTQGTAGPTSAADGFGSSITFTYDASGHLTQAQDQAGRSVKFSYTGSDLTGTTSVLNQQVSYKYASGSLLLSKTFPAGNTPSTQQYDANGRVSSQTTAAGNSTQLSYAAGNTTTITDPNGSKLTQAHSNRGAVTQIVDNTGAATNMAYDGSNHLLSYTDRLGNTVTDTYDPASGQVATYKDQLGGVTKYSYIAQTQDGFTYHLMSQATYPDGTSRSFTYDAKGNVVATTEPGGAKTTYTYDSHGFMATAVNALGGVTTMTYNSDGTVASIAQPSGDVEKYSYDDKKRMAVTTHADGTQRSYKYNDMDEPIAETNELGNTRANSYAYNSALTSLGDYAGQSVTMTYNADNLMLSQTDRNGKTTTFAYDKGGRLQSATTPTGIQIINQYDAMGRVSALADNAGTTQTRTYDKAGRIASTADGAGRSVSYTYDAIGNILNVAMGSYTTAMNYDSVHRLAQLVDGAGIASNYTYDSSGFFSAVKRGSSTISVKRDAIGNVIGITDPNGKVWASVFDSSNRVASRTDPKGNKQSYAYDSRRRLTTITTPDGTANYTYDAGNHMSKAAYSDGTQLNFTYDKNGKMLTGNGIALTYDAESAVVNSNGIAMVRDDDGKVTSMTLSPGMTITYGYDNRGMSVKIADSAGGEVDLAYDAGQMLASITRSNGIVTTLTQDAGGRLAAIADGSLASINITRDGAGKIVSSDRNLPASLAIGAGSASWSYDDGSQIASATYDKEGRLTSDGSRTYKWDMAGRLASYSGSDGAATLTYDARGNLISRTAGGNTRNYVQNYAFPMPAVSVVRDGNNQDLRYYVYTINGTPLYSIEAADNTRHFFHFDESGNTTFLTDDTGAVTDTYGISPFGEFVTHTGTAENPFTFMGGAGVMQQDQTTLYSMRARFYDGSTGRFLSRDPVVHASDPVAFNPYLYAQANPLTRFDPSGLDSSPDNTASNTLCGLGAQYGCVRSSWQMFRARMAEYFSQLQLGQQIIANVIQQAYTDANNNNSANCGWGGMCRWGTHKEDPVQVAADRLRALFGRENIAPAIIDNITAYASHGGDPTDLALGISNLLGTPSTVLLGQDAAGLTNSYKGSYLASMQGKVSTNDNPIGAAGNILAAAVGQVISNDGGSIISHDGGTIISHDGGTIISHDGGTLISSAGGAIITQDGAGIITQDGAGIITQDGAGIITQDGAGLIGEIGGALRSTLANGMVATGAGN